MRAMKDSGQEWLGAIPADWEVDQAGQHLAQVKNKNDGMVETNLLSLSYGNVKRRDIDARGGLLPESFEGYNIVEDGDIVLRFTDLQNDQRSLRTGLVTERGIITSAYTTVRPAEYEMARFLHYALHAYDVRKGFYGMGSGVRQGLKWQEAKYIRLPMPSIDEQQRIADYLDDKCAEIDKAIAAAEASIEELLALRDASISEAIGMSISADHPYGVGVPIRRLCNILAGFAFKSDHFTSEGHRLLRGINVKPGLISWEDTVYYKENMSDYETYRLYPGDLVVGLDRPWIKQGLRVAEIRETDAPCFLVQRVARLRCEDSVLSGIIRYALEAGLAKAISMDTTGISVPHISPDQLGSLRVSPDTVSKRLGIVNSLGSMDAEIGSLIEAKQSIIDDLKAYKQSLVYEVVTGKREV